MEILFSWILVLFDFLPHESCNMSLTVHLKNVTSIGRSLFLNNYIMLICPSLFNFRTCLFSYTFHCSCFHFLHDRCFCQNMSLYWKKLKTLFVFFLKRLVIGRKMLYFYNLVTFNFRYYDKTITKTMKYLVICVFAACTTFGLVQSNEGKTPD